MPENGLQIMIVADGKEYKLLREEGYQEFAEYPYRPEYNYANGSYFWVPESGSMYCTDVFEAVPDDVRYFDIVEVNPSTNQRRYLSRGVNISGDEHLFDNIKVIRAACINDLELPGTGGGNKVLVQRLESTPDALEINFQLYVRAGNTYPAYFGSDITLTLTDGTSVKIKSASVPLDEDFDRGGDLVITNATLVFPAVDVDKLLPDYDGKRFSKLTGTLCHEQFELVLDQMAVPIQ